MNIPNLVKDVLLKILPVDDHVALWDVHRSEDGHVGDCIGVTELAKRRTQGEDLKPVVLFGLVKRERLLQDPDGALVDEAYGVFYLSLPAELSTIRDLWGKARAAGVDRQNACPEEIFRRYALQDISVSVFRHACDNCWQSWRSHARLVQDLLEESPESVYEVFRVFQKAKIEQLEADYQGLADRMRHLRVDRVHEVKGLLAEVIELAGQIEAGILSPTEVVAAALLSAAKIETVADIFRDVQE